MLIRRNTKAFKTILEIITECKDRPDRQELIRLYITKAGLSIKDRISVEGIQGEAGFFYDMNYEAVLVSLTSADQQLQQSDDEQGIYFFHSSSNKEWDKTPFEFDISVKKEFGSLPELPVLRKKGKTEKYVFPTPETKTESKPAKKEKAKVPKATKAPKIAEGPAQPNYKLKRKLHFTNLDKLISRQPEFTKKDVLDYYHRIAVYMLPHMKDRPQLICTGGARNVGYSTLESLTEEDQDEAPGWLQTTQVTKGKDHLLLCNDEEHLLFYTEKGAVEFRSSATKKSSNTPDYLVVGIDSDSEFAKVIEVAITVSEIFTGLTLPSFVTTDGVSGLLIYLPLDGKSDFEICKTVAEYLCKLVRLKIPDLVTIKGDENHTYGKVSLDFTLNEAGKYIVSPYTLLREQLTVATPLSWEEVNDELRPEEFTHQTIFKRLKDVKDPLKTFFKKKIDADDLHERLKANYSFLL